MPRGCDYAVHLKNFEGRHFIVEYDSDGVALRIKERHTRIFYGVLRVHNTQYWHSGQRATKTPARILDAAHLQRVEQDTRADATP